MAGSVEYESTGSKINALTDQRNDFPSQEAIKNDIYLQVALGLGVPVELLFLLNKLTGPGIRFVLRKAQNWREQWLTKQIPGAKLDYARRIEWAIRKKLLPKPKDPYFWRCAVQYPRAITIDEGRDIAGQIAKYRNGMINLREIYGEESMQWRNEVDQKIAEHSYIEQACRKAGIDPGYFFESFTGGAGAADAPGGEDDDAADPPAPEEGEEEEEEPATADA